MPFANNSVLGESGSRLKVQELSPAPLDGGHRLHCTQF